jgi:hypothetical protein
MEEYDIHVLKIDNEFKSLIPPLSSEEYVQLEESIVNQGCLEPLYIWNKTILDGHNRYEICTRLQIPFRISYVVLLHGREEAISWICTNQLVRENVTAEARRYLIGKRYCAERVIGKHKAAATDQYVRKEGRSKMCTRLLFDETACKTTERLSSEYNVLPCTISKYANYSRALDDIAKIVPEMLSLILSGHIKISQENAVKLSELPSPEIKSLSAELLTGRAIDSIPKSIKKPECLPAALSSVKDMPAYDPDAETLSLAFTIPSWVNSVNRTRTTTNFDNISDNARQRLEAALSDLKLIIDTMLLSIREDR